MFFFFISSLIKTILLQSSLQKLGACVLCSRLVMSKCFVFFAYKIYLHGKFVIVVCQNLRTEDSRPFANRCSIQSILGRADKGAGLAGQTMTVCGWVRTMRLAKKDTMIFVMLNDGSSHDDLQIVVDADRPGFADLKGTNANTGASVCVKGR